jgi:S-adenosylmethionine:diacylglycerol 3-amino-3-carboxypropyl transferase
MPSEVAARADFGGIRYAQCWEDADILLEALDIQPGAVCLSIASAGDNTLALLSKGPARVIALDLSRAQLACLELRVAAYRALDHAGLLELIGSRFSSLLTASAPRASSSVISTCSAPSPCRWSIRGPRCGSSSAAAVARNGMNFTTTSGTPGPGA